MSGAIWEICCVASTPAMPGMFRSISTTSGATLTDDLERLGAVCRLADDLNALLFEQVAQPRPKQAVIVDDEDADAGRVGAVRAACGAVELRRSPLRPSPKQGRKCTAFGG